MLRDGFVARALPRHWLLQTERARLVRAARPATRGLVLADHSYRQGSVPARDLFNYGLATPQRNVTLVDERVQLPRNAASWLQVSRAFHPFASLRQLEHLTHAEEVRRSAKAFLLRNLFFSSGSQEMHMWLTRDQL